MLVGIEYMMPLRAMVRAISGSNEKSRLEYYVLDMAVLCCVFSEADCDAAHFGDGLLYRGQRRVAASTEHQAVEAHHRDIIRNR